MKTYSYLVTPAHKTEFLLTPFSHNNCGQILDLEDSVPIHEKQKGRENLLSYQKRLGSESRPCIRINSIKGRHGLLDILFFYDKGIFLDEIYIPKVESSSEIETVLSHFSYPLKAFALIESAKGLSQIDEILKCSDSRFVGASFGAADLAENMNVDMESDLIFQSKILFIQKAKAYGKVVSDSPLFKLGDERLLREECEKSVEIGFDQKISIHPSQVPILTEVFSKANTLSKEELEVIKVAKNTASSIFNHKNKMVGPPMVRRLLKRYDCAE